MAAQLTLSEDAEPTIGIVTISSHNSENAWLSPVRSLPIIRMVEFVNAWSAHAAVAPALVPTTLSFGSWLRSESSQVENSVLEVI